MLCDLPGVGTEVASQLLVTVGDNPDRIENEAQFAALVGGRTHTRVLGKNNPSPAQQRR
ncbi:transposase [Pseudarthrobacter sp. O4]|uniref:transposase n=1 Tax=Pseudarthrobacter sp. O4 TaxID=3418417 RepID=UPI003CF3F3A1